MRNIKNLKLSIILLIKTACFGLFSTLYINAFSQEHTFSKSQPVYISHDGQVIHPDSIPEQYKQKREYPDSWIVEFKGEPLSKKPAGLKSASLNAYQNTFTNFENDLNNIASSGNNLKSGKIIKVNRKFKNAFFGASINNVSSSSLEQIKKLSYVKTVYPNQTVKGHLAESTGIINAPTARLKHGVTGAGVKVGIIDSGIDYMHPALGGGLGEGYKVAGGYDFVNDDNDPMDDYFHGTHVAGIVASQDETYMGIAPDVTLYALKCLNQYNEGQEDDIIAAIEWSLDPNGDGNFEDKLDIINLSLGSSNGNALDAKSIAVNNVSEAGVLCVVSAGNDGGFNNIGSPGTAEKALTVGNCSKELQMAQNSSGGPSGGNGYIKPEVVAPGENITAPILNGEFGSNSGTSQAAPHVTGICALLKEKHPEWTPEEIKSAIIQSCTPLNDIGVMKQGAGLVDAEKALNCETMISPAIVNLGNISFENNFYTKEIQLSFKNESQSQKTYSLAQKNRRYGIDISFSESAFTLNPGEKKQITATFEIPIGAIPNEVPFSEANAIDGLIELTEDGSPVNLPWAITKGVRVKFKVVGKWIKFLSSFFITNESNYYNQITGYNSVDSSFTVIVKPGIYNLLFHGVEDIDFDHFLNKIVIKDNLIFNNDTIVLIDLTDTNGLFYEGVDANGDKLTESKKYFKNFALKLPEKNLRNEYFFINEDPRDSIFISSFNSNFTLYPGETADRYLDMNSFTQVNYEPITALSGNVFLRNEINDFFHTKIKFPKPKASNPSIGISNKFFGLEHYTMGDPNFQLVQGIYYENALDTSENNIDIYLKSNNSEVIQWGFGLNIFDDIITERRWDPFKLVNEEFRMTDKQSSYIPMVFFKAKELHDLSSSLWYPRISISVNTNEIYGHDFGGGIGMYRYNHFPDGSVEFKQINTVGAFIGMQEEKSMPINYDISIILSNDSLQKIYDENIELNETSFPRFQVGHGMYNYFIFKNFESTLIKYKAQAFTDQNSALGYLKGASNDIRLLQIINSKNEVTNRINNAESYKVNLILFPGEHSMSNISNASFCYKLCGSFQWEEKVFVNDSVNQEKRFQYLHCSFVKGLPSGNYDMKIKITNDLNQTTELSYFPGLFVGNHESQNETSLGNLKDTICYAGDMVHYEIPVVGFNYDSCKIEVDRYNEKIQINLIGNELAIITDEDIDSGIYTVILKLYKNDFFVEEKTFDLIINKNDLFISAPLLDQVIYVNSPPLKIPVGNVFSSFSGNEIKISVANNTNPDLMQTELRNDTLFFEFNDFDFGFSAITLQAKTSDSLFSTFLVERRRRNFDNSQASSPVIGFKVNKFIHEIHLNTGQDTLINIKNWFWDQKSGYGKIRKEITFSTNNLAKIEVYGDTLLYIQSEDESTGETFFYLKARNDDGEEIDIKIKVTINKSEENLPPTVTKQLNDIVFKNIMDTSRAFTLIELFKDPENEKLMFSFNVEKQFVAKGFIENDKLIVIPTVGNDFYFHNGDFEWKDNWYKWTRASITATDIHGAFTTQEFWIRYDECVEDWGELSIINTIKDFTGRREEIEKTIYRLDSYITQAHNAEFTSTNNEIAFAYYDGSGKIKFGTNGEFGTCRITARAYSRECGFSVSQSFNVTVIPEIAEIKAIQDTVIVCKNEDFKLNSFIKGYDSEGSTYDLNSGITWQEIGQGIWDGNQEYICNWGFCRTFIAEYNGLYDTLTVCPSQTEDFFDVRYICQGDSAFLGGKWVWETDYYRDTLQSIYGCDSTGVVLLRITEFNNIPEINNHSSIQLCVGDSVLLSSSSNSPSYIYEWSNEEFGTNIYAKESGEYRLRYRSTDNSDCISEWSEPVTITFYEPSYQEEDIFICGNDIYFGFTESGVYNRTLVSVNGCDSTVTTHLTVHPVYEMEEEITICEGTSYNGWTEPGTYTENLVSVSGCDSTVVTRLFVNDAFEVSEEVEICAGESYLDWNQPGTYSRTLQSVSGCDSIVTTHLTVHPVYELEEEITICEGASYKEWTEPGTYTENLVSVFGCDSTVVTRLSVNDAFEVTEDIEICAGEFYLEWNESGTYSRTLQSVSGCDSIVTTNLTVHPVFETEVNVTICEGGSHKGWTEAGTYTENLVSVFGCDSTVVTRLQVNDAFEVTEEVEICAGEFYLDWNETGTYFRTLQSVSGCDSTVSTHLTVHPVYELEEEFTICEGASWKGWTEPGTYTENLISVMGCDSTVVTRLQVNDAFEVSEEVEICAGESYLDWNETGTYFRTLQSVSGCDSIVSTHLTVHPVYEMEEEVTICEGDSYKGWTEPGTYTENLVSVFGCDSTVITHLTVNDAFEVTEEVEICAGESYLDWNETGTYSRTLQSVSGCDSIVTTNLTVHPVYEMEEEVTICEGASWKGWTEPGTYTENLISVFGCDSTVVTRLTVNDAFEVTEEIEICGGELYLEWNESGTYFRTLQSVSGCDSIVTTHLTVHPVYEMEEEITICEGASWKGWTEPGTYTENLISVFGCDSTVVTRLSVSPLPATPVLSQNADTLIASGEGVFAWYFEDNLIEGPISAEFIIEESGNYSATITNAQGCVSPVSESLYVVKTAVREMELKNLKVYPNPTTGKITVTGLQSHGNTTMAVYDATGRKIHAQTISSATAEIDLTGTASGIYHLKVTGNGQNKSFKIVKK